MKEKEFVSKWTSSLTENGIKKFPEDFLVGDITEEIHLPNKTLVIGEVFFGNYEVLTADGAAVLQAESLYKAKYITYSSRTKTGSVKIPLNDDHIKTTVAQYESYLDYKKNFPGEKRSNALINEIFRVLNLNRY